MSHCNLCNNLKKRSEDDIRLAFDFNPSELDRSAEAKCPACNVILAGILNSEDGWKLAEDVTHIYVFGLAKKEDSLSLELYFRDDRPKVVLELYRRERDGLLSECFHAPDQVFSGRLIVLCYSDKMTKYMRRTGKSQLECDQAQDSHFWPSSVTNRHEMVEN
jgi:hypothetical protein